MKTSRAWGPDLLSSKKEEKVDLESSKGQGAHWPGRKKRVGSLGKEEKRVGCQRQPFASLPILMYKELKEDAERNVYGRQR